MQECQDPNFFYVDLEVNIFRGIIYETIFPASEFSSSTRVLELYLQHFDTSALVSAATNASEGSEANDASSIHFPP